jgi:hypothetical protein
MAFALVRRARRHLLRRIGAQLVLHRVSADQQHHLGAGRIAQEIGPLLGGGGKARRGHLGRRDNQIEARRMRRKLEVAQGNRQVEDTGQVGAFAAELHQPCHATALLANPARNRHRAPPHRHHQIRPGRPQRIRPGAVEGHQARAQELVGEIVHQPKTQALFLGRPAQRVGEATDLRPMAGPVVEQQPDLRLRRLCRLAFDARHKLHACWRSHIRRHRRPAAETGACHTSFGE